MTLSELCTQVIQQLNQLTHPDYLPPKNWKPEGRKSYVATAHGEQLQLHAEVSPGKHKITISITISGFTGVVAITKHMNLYNFHGKVPDFWKPVHTLLLNYRG